jgi:hypothetical protein
MGYVLSLLALDCCLGRSVLVLSGGYMPFIAAGSPRPFAARTRRDSLECLVKTRLVEASRENRPT